MNDITNTPAPPAEWMARYIELIQSTPTVVDMRQSLLDLDPTGTALVNQDTKGWLEYLATKRAKGLVLDGPEPAPVMPAKLYSFR